MTLSTRAFRRKVNGSHTLDTMTSDGPGLTALSASPGRQKCNNNSMTRETPSSAVGEDVLNNGLSEVGTWSAIWRSKSQSWKNGWHERCPTMCIRATDPTTCSCLSGLLYITHRQACKPVMRDSPISALISSMQNNHITMHHTRDSCWTHKLFSLIEAIHARSYDASDTVQNQLES